MRLVSRALATLFLFTFFSVSVAHSADIVVLDLNRLYAESEAGKSVRAHIEMQREKLQAFVTDLEAPLKAEEEQLRNQQALLDPKVFRERLRQFEAKTVQLRRSVQTINEKIAELQAMGRRRIAQDIREILEAKSQELGFKVAIDRVIPLYASADVDLTEVVLSELNASITVVNLPNIAIEQVPEGTPAQ